MWYNIHMEISPETCLGQQQVRPKQLQRIKDLAELSLQGSVVSPEWSTTFTLDRASLVLNQTGTRCKYVNGFLVPLNQEEFDDSGEGLPSSWWLPSLRLHFSEDKKSLGVQFQQDRQPELRPSLPLIKDRIGDTHEAYTMAWTASAKLIELIETLLASLMDKSGTQKSPSNQRQYSNLVHEIMSKAVLRENIELDEEIPPSAISRILANVALKAEWQKSSAEIHTEARKGNATWIATKDAMGNIQQNSNLAIYTLVREHEESESLFGDAIWFMDDGQAFWTNVELNEGPDGNRDSYEKGIDQIIYDKPALISPATVGQAARFLQLLK